MHYLIIVIIIAGIVIWQTWSFISNRKKLITFGNIFPDNQNKFELIQDEKTNYVLGIKAQHKNYILDVIITSLNKYLINNKGAVSDFHLMKDIVDRNCDAKEEEIHTQIPVPLYLGLVGTMAGILVGVGFLVFSGGLENLISNPASGASEEIKKELAKEGVDGVKALMGGVALAMISSILGILYTTFGSYISRNAKANVEKNKNTFLSWMQAELLPNISNNTSGALVKMTKNLSNFNSAFAENTKDLRGTLSKVNESYKIQADLIQAINKIKIGDIASANIEVYDKLKNSTNEIGVFAEYLQKTNEYLRAIQALNQKLDDYERRTQIIENAGNFFAKNEKWLAENFDIANLEVKGAIERFKNNTGESLTKLQESLNGQILNFDSLMRQQQEKLKETLIITTEIVTESFTNTQQAFEKAISDQQTAFKDKLQETSMLVAELKNLSSIKQGIVNFEKAIERQNGKIDNLAKSIIELAQIKTSGGIIKMNLPIWAKYSLITIGTVLSLSFLIFLFLFIAALFGKYYFFQI
jgi:hypothetical protein